MKRGILIFIFIFFVGKSFAQTWSDVNEKAVKFHDEGDYTNAVKYYEEGLLLAKKEFGAKSSQYSTALNNYAIVLYADLGEFEKAEELLLQALEIRKRVYGEKSLKYAHTLGCLGSCYQQMGKYSLSEEYYLKSLNIDSVVSGTETDDYATGLSNIGLLYQNMGKYEQAETCLIKSVEIRKKLKGNTDLGYTTSLSNLALLYLELGKYEKAEKMFLEVWEADKKLLGQEHPGCGTDLINLASLYSETGEIIKAEQFYLQGMNIWKKSVGEMSQQYASALNNLAMLYNDMGLQEKSEELYIKCSKIGEEVWGNGHPEYASCINNLANLYEDMGRIDEAESLFLQAARIRKVTLGEEHPDFATSLNSLATIYYNRGKYDEAENFYIAALDILIKNYGNKHPQVGNQLLNLALLYTTTNQLDKVEDIYLISSDIIKESNGENSYPYAGSIWGIARMYRIMNRFDESEKYYLKADSLFNKVLTSDHPDYAKLIHGHAILKWDMRDTNEAGILFQKSDSLFLAHLQKLFRFTTEYEKTKGLMEVENYFQRSQSYYFSSHKTNSSSSVSALNLHLATNRWILSSVTELKERIFSEGNDSVLKLYSDWEKYSKIVAKELSKPLAERSGSLKTWQEETNKMEKQLNKLSNSFKESMEGVMPDFEKVKNSLGVDEAAIEFVSFEYKDGIAGNDPVEYVAIVTIRDLPQPYYIPLFEEKQLAGLLNGDSLRTFANLLYSDATVRNIDHDITYGDSLYRLVWNPIASLLKGKKTIYYSLTGLLHKLNIDAIPCYDNKLISDIFQLNRLSSTAELLYKDNLSLNIGSVILYGGIEYNVDENTLRKSTNKENKTKNDNFQLAEIRSLNDSLSRSGFSYLEGSKLEVDNIYKILNENKVTGYVYSGVNGNEESVKKMNYKNAPTILHFSTHGFFIPEIKKQITRDSDEESISVFTSADDPLFRTGLILAGADYVWKGNTPIEGVEDGILTAHEVSQLYLPNTKLVVMSACETGLGDIKGTEGVYGLQRAFKMAGVDYIIVSLWKVLDKETSEFMTLFYQNLMTKKSIAASFKLTQDSMKNKYRNEPYKWAGFVLVK